MPSTWGLRRRPTSPSEEEEEILQDRYAARLDELLRHPASSDVPSGEPIQAPRGDDASMSSPGSAPPAAVYDGTLRLDDGLELRPAIGRVPFRIRPKPPGLAVADGRPFATRSGDGAPEPETPGGGPEAAETGGTTRPGAGSPGRTLQRPPQKPVSRRGRAKVPAAPPPVACPYCAVLLQPPPPSSRRCPRCRQRIVVKKAADRIVYLTEAAVPVFEAERRRAADHRRHVHARDRWLRLATTAGAPDGRVRRLAGQLASEAAVEAARALYMTTVDRAFRSARRERRWEAAARLRRDQAAALDRIAGRPRPPSDEVVALYRDGVNAQLRGISEVAREAELAGPSCCDACAVDQGRVFRIAGERREPRLPHAGCPTGLCRCRWTLAVKDVAELRRLMRLRSRPAPAGHPDPQPAP
jgi:hypothetical protein